MSEIYKVWRVTTTNDTDIETTFFSEEILAYQFAIEVLMDWIEEDTYDGYLSKENAFYILDLIEKNQCEEAMETYNSFMRDYLYINISIDHILVHTEKACITKDDIDTLREEIEAMDDDLE